jgi:signal transduction histidine kinase
MSDEDERVTPPATQTSSTGNGHITTTPEVSTIAPDEALRWLNILHEVTEGAMAHLELSELLHDLLGRIREAMALDNAAILLLDEDQRYLTVYAARGPEEVVTGRARIRMGRGVAGSIAASGRPRIIDDLSQVEVENPLLRATVHSLVGAPLFIRGEVHGVIHLDSARPRHFTEQDVRLLEIIAGRAALAIDHAQLYEAERAARRQAEAASRRLQALQTVSDAALTHAGLADLLDALLARIQQTMHVDNVAILLPDVEGANLRMYTVRGPESEVAEWVRVPMAKGVAGRIAARREPYIIDDLRQVEVANPFLQKYFRSLLGVPLLHEDRLVGVLHVSTIAPRHFGDDERELLEVIAERIAPAIDRAHDFEAMREHREAAERQIQNLEEATRCMDDFLSIASHELRTPLTSAYTNLQLLDRQLNMQHASQSDEPSTEDLTRTLRGSGLLIRRALQNIGRLNRLIGELVDASRVREQRLGLRLAPQDLNAIVRETVEEVRQVNADRTLHLTLSHRAPLPVRADADRISQVIANYLGNALKYSRIEDPVWIEVRTEGRGTGAQARVEVRDRGPGIPLREQELIWERFYRVSGVSHRSGSQVGLGLGLYISRDIVERHGGQVGVTSESGAGSTFWFTLPLARREPASPADSGAKPARDHARVAEQR